LLLGRDKAMTILGLLLLLRAQSLISLPLRRDPILRSVRD
jgi:hypothetical protein